MASATATHPAETKAPGPKHNIEAMREDYYERIAKHDMAPLWKVMNSVVTKEPVTRCAPVDLALRRHQAPGDGIGRPDHAPRRPSAAC